MLLGFLMICVFSAVMHVFLIQKKVLRTQRYEPVYPDSQPQRETAGFAQGLVSSLSADRLNLQVGSKRLTFYLAEGVQAPPVGSLVEVRYDNDRALEVKILSPAQHR